MIGSLDGTLKGLAGVSFASFNYTTKGTGETAKYLMILGASVTNLYEKDIAKLVRYVSLLTRIGAQPHVILAAQELLASRRESLDKGIGNNSAYTQADTYTHLDNLPGVKIHNETGELYISGLQERKEVIAPGTYKKVNSAPKTLAKKKIEKALPSGRFRTLALGNITGARVRGHVLELS